MQKHEKQPQKQENSLSMKLPKNHFEWDFEEFEKHERGFKWYVVAGLIAIGLIIYSVLTSNFLFLVIILLSIFILGLYHYKEVELISFSVSEKGIAVDTRFYPWKELTSFYIIYEPPLTKNLYFEFQSWMKPMLAIPLYDQNPVELRKFLLNFIKEDLDKEEEPLAHSIGRALKL